MFQVDGEALEMRIIQMVSESIELMDHDGYAEEVN